MGFFSNSSPFDGDVEKATNENNTSEDWSLILEICDKVGNNPGKAKECSRSIAKRLQLQDPHVVLQAITLLDACVQNCGKIFQLEVASRDFETELKKVFKKWPSNTKVGAKLRVLIRKWSDCEFKKDSELSLMTSLYKRFQNDGIDMTILSDPTPSRTLRPADPNSVSSQQEVDDIARAIELSLKESSSPKSTGYTSSYAAAPTNSSLYPSVSGAAASAPSNNSASGGLSSIEPRKVRALYDFEAAEENELTFFANEIIHVLDDSDTNWWKGCNQRGEGLFPANFVTSDLNADAEKKAEKKGVQFNETVEVKTVPKVKTTEIDEGKIDRLLMMLHEADPSVVDTSDPEEMISLEDEVNEMGPLIDAELEKVDRKHAQLTALSESLVDAMNLYHALMKEPSVGMLGKPVGGPSPGLYHTLPSLHHHMPPPPQGPPQMPQLVYQPPPGQMSYHHMPPPPGQQLPVGAPPGMFNQGQPPSSQPLSMPPQQPYYQMPPPPQGQ